VYLRSVQPEQVQSTKFEVARLLASAGMCRVSYPAYLFHTKFLSFLTKINLQKKKHKLTSNLLMFSHNTIRGHSHREVAFLPKSVNPIKYNGVHTRTEIRYYR
jgi:hypothetical protein